MLTVVVSALVQTIQGVTQQDSEQFQGGIRVSFEGRTLSRCPKPITLPQSVTGLGTPNVTKLIEFFKKLP